MGLIYGELRFRPKPKKVFTLPITTMVIKHIKSKEKNLGKDFLPKKPTDKDKTVVGKNNNPKPDKRKIPTNKYEGLYAARL